MRLDRHRGRPPALGRVPAADSPAQAATPTGGVIDSLSAVIWSCTRCSTAGRRSAFRGCWRGAGGARAGRGGRRAGAVRALAGTASRAARPQAGRAAEPDRPRGRREPVAGDDRGRGDPAGRARRLRRCSAGPTSAAGIWDLLAGRPPSAATRRGELIDESDHPGLGGQPRLADLHPGLLLDRVPARVRRRHDRAVAAAAGWPLLGIVLRGVGFAFRTAVQRLRGAAVHRRRVRGLLAAHAVLHGHGGRRGRHRAGAGPRRPGNALAAWTRPTALLTGFLFVAACAYLGAVFLVLEARQRGRPAA